MKYKYKVNGLDCANCTQKLEDALKENKIEEYERLHRAVWPGVLKKIHLVLMKLFI